jgi:hypothetical protein
MVQNGPLAEMLKFDLGKVIKLDGGAYFALAEYSLTT